MATGRATADDVARAAGVSRATVSYVLNDTPHQKISAATRARVRDAAQRLAYTPSATARSLSRGRSDIVVMLIPDWPLGPVIPEVIDAISAEFESAGLELMLYQCRQGHPIERLWRTVAPAAVVRFGSLGADDDASLRQAHIGHLIEVTDTDLEPGLNLFPGLEVGQLQGQHLITRGHTRIGYAWPGDSRVEPIAQTRLSGLVSACERTGVAPPDVQPVSLDPDQAQQAVQAWLASGITGVACFNDDVALSLIRAARSLNVAIPGDLALVGVDNQPWGAAIDPALTTVGSRTAAMGQTIARTIIAAMTGRTPPTAPSELLDLVLRGST